MQFCFLIAALSHRLRGSFYLFTYSVLDFVNVYGFKIKKADQLGQPNLILFVFMVITHLLLRLLRFAGRSISRRLFLAYRSRIAG